MVAVFSSHYYIQWIHVDGSSTGDTRGNNQVRMKAVNHFNRSYSGIHLPYAAFLKNETMMKQVADKIVFAIDCLSLAIIENRL